MFDKIKENYENFKLRQKEKREACWLNFKSKLPENIQNKLNEYELEYKEFKKTLTYEVVETVIFVVVMVIIIRFFVFEIRWIPSASMNPTLIEGDRIIVERFSRFFTTPKHGDIMVFYPPSTELSRKPIPLLTRLIGIKCKDVAYIKRVIGVPGDKIEIKPELSGATYVYVNGVKQKEGYIKSIYEYPQCMPNQANIYLPNMELPKCGPFELGEDEYFMMGDNRGHSYDSRYWGTVTKDRFVGRATTIFWPLNRIRLLKKIEK